MPAALQALQHFLLAPIPQLHAPVVAAYQKARSIRIEGKVGQTGDPLRKVATCLREATSQT